VAEKLMGVEIFPATGLGPRDPKPRFWPLLCSSFSVFLLI